MFLLSNLQCSGVQGQLVQTLTKMFRIHEEQGVFKPEDLDTFDFLCLQYRWLVVLPVTKISSKRSFCKELDTKSLQKLRLDEILVT